MRLPLLRPQPRPDRLPDLRDGLPDRGCARRHGRASPPLPKGPPSARRPGSPPTPVAAVKPEEAPEADAEDALAAIEGEEEPAAAEEDETFLEAEEEDGSDMSNIIGGPVAETDERQ